MCANVLQMEGETGPLVGQVSALPGKSFSLPEVLFTLEIAAVN